MCILKIYSDVDSFESFSKRTNLPIYSLYSKGELKNKHSDKEHTNYRISLDVSEKEWDDFDGQVRDAILFLEKYSKQIQDLCTTHLILDAYLDFPLWSRLDENIVNQSDHIPRELIKIAGKLNVGIEIGFYAKDAFSFESDLS